MVSGYDGSIRINTRIDGRGFNAGMKSMIGTLGKFAAMAGVAFGVAGVVSFGKAAVATASQAEQALSGLQFLTNATGRSFKQAQQFIEDFTSDGLVPATNAIEAYKNMVSRGYDTSQIEQMMNIMKDSAVINRQSGMSIGEAIERTTQGLRMENSLLTDSVGIQKNVAKMWQEYAREIGTTSNALTDAQKRQAEFNGFMAEGGVYAGAAGKYLNTYAGRMAQLSASMYNLKVAVGKSIIPVISSVLPYIKAAVDALTRWFNRVAMIMSILFGVDISESATNANAAMAGMAGATNDAADAQDRLADSTKAAGKAAKGALAAFDELNVLQQAEEPSGGGIAGIEAIGLSDTLSTPALDTSATDSSLEALKAKMEGFKKSLAAFFEPMREPLARLGEAWGRLKQAISDALKPMFGDDFKAALGEFMSGVRGGLIVVIELLTMWLEKLAEVIEKNPEKFRILIGVVAMLAAAFLIVQFPILKVIAIISILLYILGKLKENWPEIKKWAIDTWEKIKEKWHNAGEWFKEKVTDPIKNAFKTATEWISDKWNKVFNGIKGIAADAVNWIIRMLNKIQIKVPDWVPGIGGKQWGINIQEVTWGSVPAYASGAVIQPNHPRLAIVGDHRTQREVIAPEDMIRKIVREETAGLQNIPQMIDNRIYIGDREIYRVVKRVDRQQGKSLISGWSPA